MYATTRPTAKFQEQHCKIAFEVEQQKLAHIAFSCNIIIDLV